VKLKLTGGPYDGKVSEFENHKLGQTLVIHGERRSFYSYTTKTDEDTDSPVYNFVRYAKDDDDDGSDIKPIVRYLSGS
jgi:hypothetical protein